MGLIPYVGVDNVVLFLFTLTSPAVTAGARQMVRLERSCQANIPHSHNGPCIMYDVAGEKSQ
jgi:hypothetical protein